MRDSEGNLLFRDHGTVTFEFVFDTFGDSQQGGELISEELISVLTPQPGRSSPVADGAAVSLLAVSALRHPTAIRPGRMTADGPDCLRKLRGPRMPVRVGNFELVALSKASTRQVADLSDVLGSQLILAQAGNTDESNVAMLLTRTELVVTGSTLRRIPLAQVSAVEAAGLSLRDGTWIPWNPFGGDKERNQMLAAVAQAASLTAPKGASVDGLATAPAPIVQARAARERGAQFLEIQLEVAESTCDVSFGAADSGSRVARGHRDILGDIEAEGWHLENVGYVFIPTGHSTRAKILGTGESVAVSGVTVGVYLFRATKPASTVD